MVSGTKRPGTSRDRSRFLRPEPSGRVRMAYSFVSFHLIPSQLWHFHTLWILVMSLSSDRALGISRATSASPPSPTKPVPIPPPVPTSNHSLSLDYTCLLPPTYIPTSAFHPYPHPSPPSPLTPTQLKFQSPALIQTQIPHPVFKFKRPGTTFPLAWSWLVATTYLRFPRP